MKKPTVTDRRDGLLGRARELGPAVGGPLAGALLCGPVVGAVLYLFLILAGVDPFADILTPMMVGGGVLGVLGVLVWNRAKLREAWVMRSALPVGAWVRYFQDLDRALEGLEARIDENPELVKGVTVTALKAREDLAHRCVVQARDGVFIQGGKDESVLSAEFDNLRALVSEASATLDAQNAMLGDAADPVARLREDLSAQRAAIEEVTGG